jgi:undecaprenyl diphosphate synthase
MEIDRGLRPASGWPGLAHTAPGLAASLNHPVEAPRRLLIVLQGHYQWMLEQNLTRPAAFGAAAGRLLELIDFCALRRVQELSLKLVFEGVSSLPSVAKGEVAHVFTRYITAAVHNMRRHGVRLQCDDALGALDPLTRGLVSHVARRTQDNTGMRLTFSIVPGAGAAAPVASPVVPARHEAARTAQIEPDFVIRTGGHLPPHQAMLWDTQKTALYFTNQLWPAFGAASLERAFAWFEGTNRAAGFEFPPPKLSRPTFVAGPLGVPT